MTGRATRDRRAETDRVSGDFGENVRTAPASAQAGSSYDKAYFDKWYRSRRHRVKSPVELARQVAFVVSAAEWVLARPVRTVLDVGAGEGQWRAALRKHRPRLSYVGVDPSSYAIERFGARRNLHLGTIDTLMQLDLEGPFDLVVCCGMLNYVPIANLPSGLRQVAALTGGVA